MNSVLEKELRLGGIRMDVNRVLVIGEMAETSRPTTLTRELQGLALDLAGERGLEVVAVFLGRDSRTAAEESAGYGAARVYFSDEPRYERYNLELYLAALRELYERERCDVFLAGHTAVGQDLLPRLAFALGGSLVTDCVGLALEPQHDRPRLVCSKPVYGGNALGVYAPERRPLMATVRPRVGESSSPRPASGEILRLECAGAPVLIELGEQVYEEAAGPRLEDAGVVVAGGRGVGGEQGFELLLELTSLLGGATGASRPACDAGWISNSLQIGITGKMVAPDVYLAVGISGSIQHLSGMLDSRKIVAINKDPEANIFTVSDYGAVGEWQQVLPAFLSGLRTEIEGRTG